MTRRILLFALAACLAGAFAWPKPQDESYTRIARLSYVEGHVSFRHDSDVDWAAASINLPVEPGDRIYTGSDGRAEIEFDDGSTFRMAESTDAEFLALKQGLIQVRMLVGLSTLNVSGDADFEVDTPAAAFNTLREGIYRFDVVENGDTDAIVRKGALEAANNEFSRRLRAGDLLHVSPGDRNPEVSLYERRDEWDEWNDRRNADLQVYGNQRYLPDNVYVGASDLYRYGRWMNVDTYGTAWVPYGIDAAWAPYSVGRWCYRPFYGWTWISYEPWGWLPYHYGRWYRSSLYGWCWLPGPAYSFNFWSPGLVTFYHGPGWVSWCPLGPGDYYDVRNYHYNRGIYGHQLAELRRLSTRGVGDPFNRYVPGAFRTAQLEQFRDGSFDNKTRNTRWGNIDRPWSQGTLVQDRLNIQPSTKSYSAVTDRIAVRPSSQNTRPVVVRNVPERELGNRGQFTRITNPQIPSIQPRSARTREEQGEQGSRNVSRPNTRVVQTPGSSSESGSASRDGRRMDNQRLSGSRSNSEDSIRSGSARTVPEAQAPAGRQNPTRQRNERTFPELRTIPQRAPEASPRSESRRESSFRSLPGSDSGSGATGTPGSDNAGRPQEMRSEPSYSAPQRNERTVPELRSVPSRAPESNPRSEPRQESSSRSERWSVVPSPGVTGSPESDNVSRPGNAGRLRSQEMRSAPLYVAPSAPRSDGGERRGNSGSRVMRAPDSGRSPSYSAPAPRQSSPSPSYGGGRSSSAPSPSHGNSGGNSRNSSEGSSGRRR